MPKPRNTGLYGRPKYNQAAKVVARFGGEAALSRLLNISRISVYRWQYSRPYGSDGLIPTAKVERIKELARANGVLLRPEDWVPETNRWDGNTLQPLEANRKAYVPMGVDE